MSGCRFDAIEAWVYGELDPAEEAAVEAHARGCSACAGEAAALRAERGLFAERARLEGPPPGLATVLARARWSVDPAPRAPERKAPSLLRRVPWAALSVAAAAAVAGIFAVPPPPEGPAPSDDARLIRAEPAVCFEDEGGYCDSPAITWTVGPQTNPGAAPRGRVAPPRDADLTATTAATECGARLFSTPDDECTCASRSCVTGACVPSLGSEGGCIQ
jgi:Putative zinc-finger